MSEIRVNPSFCDGCGACVECCPRAVFSLREITEEERKSLSLPGKIKVRVKGKVKSFVTNSEDCITCGLCVNKCHEKAISLYGMKRWAR